MWYPKCVHIGNNNRQLFRNSKQSGVVCVGCHRNATARTTIPLEKMNACLVRWWRVEKYANQQWHENLMAFFFFFLVSILSSSKRHFYLVIALVILNKHVEKTLNLFRFQIFMCSFQNLSSSYALMLCEIRLSSN